MLLAFLEFGEGISLIAYVHHDHGPSDIDMQFLLGDTHKGGNSFHVSLDTIRVGGTFHQQFSRTEQKIQFAP